MQNSTSVTSITTGEAHASDAAAGTDMANESETVNAHKVHLRIYVDEAGAQPARDWRKTFRSYTVTQHNPQQQQKRRRWKSVMGHWPIGTCKITRRRRKRRRSAWGGWNCCHWQKFVGTSDESVQHMSKKRNVGMYASLCACTTIIIINNLMPRMHGS
jgi:hypothetical protein